MSGLHFDSVLFLRVANSARSQMAQGPARDHLAQLTNQRSLSTTTTTSDR